MKRRWEILRDRFGVSQAQIVEGAGLSQGAVSKIINGQMISRPGVERIAEYLGIAPKELIRILRLESRYE